MVDLPDAVKNMVVAVPKREAPAPRTDRPQRPQGGGQRFGGGAPGRGGPRGAGGGAGGRRPFQRRKRRLFGSGKVCQCCVRKIKHVDYKDLDQLKFFVAGGGKILPRRMSGACAKHQRMITSAIKRARNIALLPFKG